MTQHLGMPGAQFLDPNVLARIGNLEMRAKGTQPTRQGGFGYLRGPDGAMVENAQAGATERFNHVHMYHEHPNCAMNWYVTHLGAKMPARQSAAAPTPPLENCQT